MTLDSNPDFWKWLIRKQRENAIKNGREFEPIPLHIELEKPNQEAVPVEAPEKSSDNSIVDFTINDDTIIVY